MTAKTRIKKLESVKHVDFFEHKVFWHEVYADGDRYKINGVEVDAARYDKELAEYSPLARARGVPSEIEIKLTSEMLTAG